MVEESKDNKATSEIKNTKEVKDDKGMPEWLTPILSALGSMGGSYMLFIKPLQDRMDALVMQVSDLREEVKELKQQNKELEKELEDIQQNQDSGFNGYLPTKKTIAQGSYVKKRV